MKSIFVYLIIFLLGWSACAQQIYSVEIESFQQVELAQASIGSDISVPNRIGTAVLGGAHDVEGLGQYLVFNGSNLRIQRKSVNLDGTINVELGREDGRKFFDKYPVLRAKLIPSINRRDTLQTGSDIVNSEAN